MLRLSLLENGWNAVATLRNMRRIVLCRSARGILVLCLLPTLALQPGSVNAVLIHEHGENDSHTHLLHHVGDEDSRHREHGHSHGDEPAPGTECKGLVGHDADDGDGVVVLLAGPVGVRARNRTQDSSGVPDVLLAHYPAKNLGTCGEFFGLSPPARGGTARPISSLSAVANILLSNHALLL